MKLPRPMNGTRNARPPRPTALAGATLLVATAATVSGCVTARVEEAQRRTVSLDSDEAIVILVRRQNAQSETEDKFTDCIGRELKAGGEALNLRSESEFVDQLFPWFEPRLAPPGPEALPTLLDKPGVAERIADSGVRYLVWVEGQTETIGGGGNISCTISTGGAACLGLQWWDKDSSYEASIWDLKQGEDAGTISAEATGTSYMPAIVVPIPLIARTQSAACKGLADQLRDFVGDGSAI